MNMAEDHEYRALAQMVRNNFSLVSGSKAYFCMSTSIAPAQVSNSFSGYVKSWKTLKTMVRWYHETYTNIGDWDEIFTRLINRFPDEDWQALAKKVAANQTPYVKPTPRL